MKQQQCEQYGTVHTARTGTSVIRSAHNGPAQVAQVVVCHALCAAREIEWEAFPQSWQCLKCVWKNPVFALRVCVSERKQKIEGERMSQSESKCTSL